MKTRSSLHKTEISPYSKVCASTIGGGILSLCLGISYLPGGNIAGNILGISLLLGSAFMIFISIWLFRKRIVIEERSVRLIGLVEGEPDLQLKLVDIQSVGFNHLRQMAEVKTQGKIYFVKISEKSEAHKRLISMAEMSKSSGT